MVRIAAEKDSRSDLSGFVLERTARRMKQFVQERLSSANTGITVDQWVVLQELNRQEGLSQLEIAKATYKDAPTMTRIIDLLCEKGFTRRLADPADRRRFSIQLTAAGREKIAEVLPIIQSVRREAWSALSEEEIADLSRMLDAVFTHLCRG